LIVVVPLGLVSPQPFVVVGLAVGEVVVVGVGLDLLPPDRPSDDQRYDERNLWRLCLIVVVPLGLVSPQPFVVVGLAVGEVVVVGVGLDLLPPDRPSDDQRYDERNLWRLCVCAYV
ncbi:hypothetical protein Tco_0881112, partial [Tanacetum coccineum]